MDGLLMSQSTCSTRQTAVNIIFRSIAQDPPVTHLLIGASVTHLGIVSDC